MVMGGCRPAIPPSGLPAHRHQAGQAAIAQANPETAASLKALEDGLLNQADASLASGDASKALQFVAKAVSCCNEASSDRALQIIRAALDHPSLRLENPAEAAGCLQRLTAAAKGAGYGPVAGCWVASLQELSARDAEIRKQRSTIRARTEMIETLNRQIEQLKAVDLELVQPEQTAGGDGDETNGQQPENHSGDR
jgi:hypothetical protein